MERNFTQGLFVANYTVYKARVAERKPLVSELQKKVRLLEQSVVLCKSKFNIFQFDRKELLWRKPNTAYDR